MESFGKFRKILEKIENFGKCWIIEENFGFFWRISNYDFQSRRQIMAARGVYESRTHFYLSRFAGRVLIVKGFVAKYIITCSWLWREGLEIFCPNKNYILSHKSSVFYHTLCPNIFQFHHQSFHITTNVTFETKIIVQIWINLWNVEWHLRLKYYADALYLLLLLKRAAIKSHANPTRVTKELRLAGPAFLTYSLSTLSTKTVTF